MKNFMLDLETMGTGPTAAICAIGVVRFDLETEKIDAEYYGVVDLVSSVKAGGVIDAQTVQWWMNQSEEARRIFVKDVPRQSEETILREFKWFTHENDPNWKESILWGNGSDFDNVILRSAFERHSIPLPWKYSRNRCYRTLKSLRPDIEIIREGTHHNALDDARSQAEHAIRIFKAIGVQP